MDQTLEEHTVTKKTIEQVEVAHKRVLIRVDFNVPMKGGVIGDDRRIRGSMETIKSVVDRGGRAILLSHLGRPKGEGFEPQYSLKPVAQRLSELLGRPVGFPSHDCVDADAVAAVGALEDSEILLLENLRFHKGEKLGGDAEFSSALAAMGDVYCNDAFGTCHRADSSMVALPRAMAGKPRVAGFLLNNEIRYLSESLKNPAKPVVAVLGGAKVSDKIKAVEHFLTTADHVLIGGAMAYTFIEALGKNVGASRVERGSVNEAKRLLDMAASEKGKLHLPVDHVCSTAFDESAGDIEIYEDEIPDGYMGMDIGPRTQSHFAQTIASAKTVVWAGPMGVFEWRPFRIGTREIARSMIEATQAGGVTIVGGGDTASAAQEFDAADKVSHVSTGGGASLAMLSGDAMPAIDLLDEA